MNIEKSKLYFKRIFKSLNYQSKEINFDNIKQELEKEIIQDGKWYIAYSKCAVYLLSEDKKKINLKNLINKIDYLVKYEKYQDVIELSKNI